MTQVAATGPCRQTTRHSASRAWCSSKNGGAEMDSSSNPPLGSPPTSRGQRCFGSSHANLVRHPPDLRSLRGARQAASARRETPSSLRTNIALQPTDLVISLSRLVADGNDVICPFSCPAGRRTNPGSPPGNGVVRTKARDEKSRPAPSLMRSASPGLRLTGVNGRRRTWREDRSGRRCERRDRIEFCCRWPGG